MLMILRPHLSRSSRILEFDLRLKEDEVSKAELHYKQVDDVLQQMDDGSGVTSHGGWKGASSNGSASMKGLLDESGDTISSVGASRLGPTAAIAGFSSATGSSRIPADSRIAQKTGVDTKSVPRIEDRIGQEGQTLDIDCRDERPVASALTASRSSPQLTQDNLQEKQDTPKERRPPIVMGGDAVKQPSVEAPPAVSASRPAAATATVARSNYMQRQAQGTQLPSAPLSSGSSTAVRENFVTAPANLTGVTLPTSSGGRTAPFFSSAPVAKGPSATMATGSAARTPSAHSPMRGGVSPVARGVSPMRNGAMVGGHSAPASYAAPLSATGSYPAPPGYPTPANALQAPARQIRSNPGSAQVPVSRGAYSATQVPMVNGQMMQVQQANVAGSAMFNWDM